MKAAWLALAVALLSPPVWGQSAEVLQIEYTNPGLSPWHWTLTIHSDGNGHFLSEQGKAPADGQQFIDVPDQDRAIRLSAPFTERVFVAVRRGILKGRECESHLKVAFQGWKKISYTGPATSVTCEFNYSKDREIQDLGESLLSVASTILEGARIESLLIHDPLGLDKEMEFLSAGVADGRLRQICVIRGVLERLAEDSAVMERVRKRARMLLARAES